MTNERLEQIEAMRNNLIIMAWNQTSLHPEGIGRAVDALTDLLQGYRHFHDACIRQNDSIGQTLGLALGYPRYCDPPLKDTFPEATEADGVFIGEHVAESLADEMVHRFKDLEQAFEISQNGLAEYMERCEALEKSQEN